MGHTDVRAWGADLSKTPNASATTQVFLNLRSILEFASEDGRLPRNPCDKVRLPRVTKAKKPYLTNGQVVQLAEQCGIQADIILTLTYTGMRWGELAALKVESVDFTKHRISISESVSEVSGRLIEGAPKSHENRSIPFPDFLTDFLQHRCSGTLSADHVFATAKGDVIRNGNFRRDHFTKTLNARRGADPEFPKVTPHNLRDTAASLVVSAGANVKSIQRMLRHAKAAMTLDAYAELF
ncbi:MAG: tyrosine-type recombinase/integrase [Actinomycetales bacterium]|nr:tyrosine-type recombinase/integrase [Actinomycetales bacterium]